MTKRPSHTSPAEALSDLRQLIRREGAEEAFAALRSVCNDPKAPAPARATAATSIFRAAGLFDKTDAAADDKPLSELTAEELNRIVRRHQRAPTTSSAPRAERGAPDEDEVDAFE
ncbi:MAG: hypothetical protein WDN46_20570 [Methylocella sp.]